MKAIRSSVEGKRKRKDIKVFMEDIKNKANILENIILNVLWIPSAYKIKFLQDKAKIRELHIPEFYPDRIIHHMINNILEEIFIPTFIKDTYQCMKGRGVHKAVKKAESNIHSGLYQYVLKVDLSKFYPSINNEILKNKIHKKIKDPKFLKIVDRLIDSDIGVPIGNHTSQLLANIYLNDLDHIMKGLSKSYVRYADDFIILGTKEEVRHALEVTKEYVIKNKLRLNPSTQYFPLAKRPLLFLGFRIYTTHTRPSKKLIMKLSPDMAYHSKASYFGWVKNSSSGVLLVKLFMNEINNGARHFIKPHIRELINKVKRVKDYRSKHEQSN